MLDGCQQCGLTHHHGVRFWWKERWRNYKEPDGELDWGEKSQLKQHFLSSKSKIISGENIQENLRKHI